MVLDKRLALSMIVVPICKNEHWRIDFQVDYCYTQWYDTGFAIDTNGYPMVCRKMEIVVGLEILVYTIAMQMLIFMLGTLPDLWHKLHSNKLRLSIW